jgi:hypothetical protein
LRIVAQQTNACVAAVAEQSANNLSRVIVIYRETANLEIAGTHGGALRLLADGADAALLREKFLVVLGRHPKLRSELAHKGVIGMRLSPLRLSGMIRIRMGFSPTTEVVLVLDVPLVPLRSFPHGIALTSKTSFFSLALTVGVRL